MVEAAMVLPILILVTFSLILAMVHFYTYHQGQIQLHKEMIIWSRESDAVFRIQKKTQTHQTKLDGMVYHVLKKEKDYRIYAIKGVSWIRLGETEGLFYE